MCHFLWCREEELINFVRANGQEVDVMVDWG